MCTYSVRGYLYIPDFLKAKACMSAHAHINYITIYILYVVSVCTQSFSPACCVD